MSLGEKVIVRKSNGTAIFFALLLTLGAAFWLGSPVRSEAISAMSAETPRPTATLMPNATATPTIGYMQTAIVAEATSAEAIRLMVAVTAEQDRRNFEQAAWTVTAESVALQYQVMTQQAAQFTATAYATSMPATQTRQAAIDSARSTEVMLTIVAPTQIHALAQSQTYAEYADEMQAAEITLKVVIAIFIVTLALALLVNMLIKLRSSFANVKVITDETESDPLPLAVDVRNSNVLLRAEIPCTLEQLIELAEGVIRRNMTLAVNQWEGTCVHKSIKEIRAFFIQHHFAKVLVGKGGELGIESEGELFLSDVLRLGSPPPPYTTA